MIKISIFLAKEALCKTKIKTSIVITKKTSINKYPLHNYYQRKCRLVLLEMLPLGQIECKTSIEAKLERNIGLTFCKINLRSQLLASLSHEQSSIPSHVIDKLFFVPKIPSRLD